MIRTVAALLVLTLGLNNSTIAQHMALPHVLVYKTRANYNNKVPVTLTDDKTKITSYPSPGDIKTGGIYALPVLLHKGYLLDRRGIGPNSAFTRYTYKMYSSLSVLPDMAELYKKIADKNPLTELYDCGVRGNGHNDPGQLNEIIDQKLLREKCKKIK
jgi:hypothetical protein